MEESDTGGLDMYVDIPDDAKGALLSSQDEGDDDTGEIPYEWTRDESNEGSNLSGEQNMSLSGQEGAFQGWFSFLIVIYTSSLFWYGNFIMHLWRVMLEC